MNLNIRKEKKSITYEEKQTSPMSTFTSCVGFITLIIVGICLLAFFFVGPMVIKEWLFSTDDAIAFATEFSVSILVMMFIIFWFFACLYFVKGGKRFLLLMTVPFMAWVLLFFNYYLVTLDGVKASPYFQIIPKFIEWKEMDEIAFVPSYRVGRRDTTFEIKIACLIDGKSHWIETSGDLKKLQKLKEMLASQGDVPVFIYPLDKGDINRLSEIKDDNINYFKNMLKFLEVKDINNYKEEHILVNESFYE
ncbi:hypothetical protein SM124_22600 [Bacillus sp. 31A1R]|uniref:Uncharacterized protein n=1 Tax=Robertmurraya mangrovi TaxID=3098077 RepID=A0ABU5J4X0_9BACI|nr:hypothetical protein [Bacillus sp. 31A1R]MDZ5474469.1 hypothetical protein [Bacillus sp. 31A1R]